MNSARTTGWGFAIFSLLLTGACDAPTAPTAGLPETPSVRDTVVISRVLSPDGVYIAYDTRGAGSPVLVLVHGWSCDRTYWTGQADALATDYRVVTLDLAGHGASGPNRSDWTIEAFGADVATVVEKLDLRDVILVGHSMGADVVTDAARRLPGRVKGVIWLDQYNEIDTRLSDEKVAEIAAPFRADFNGTTKAFARGMFPANADPALVERVAGDMASAPPEIAVPMLIATKANSRNIAAAVAALDVPVVTINAGNSPTNAEALERRGVKAVVMPGTGHFLMMDNPEGFNALLKQTIVETFGG